MRGDEHFKGTDVERWLRCEDITLADPSKFRSHCHELCAHVNTLIHLPDSLMPAQIRLWVPDSL